MTHYWFQFFSFCVLGVRVQDFWKLAICTRVAEHCGRSFFGKIFNSTTLDPNLTLSHKKSFAHHSNSCRCIKQNFATPEKKLSFGFAARKFCFFLVISRIWNFFSKLLSHMLYPMVVSNFRYMQKKSFGVFLISLTEISALSIKKSEICAHCQSWRALAIWLV